MQADTCLQYGEDEEPREPKDLNEEEADDQPEGEDMPW